MGVLAILGYVSQAVMLVGTTAANASRIYGVVADVFKSMADEGRDEPTQAEINMVREAYEDMRSDFHTDDEKA